MTICVSLIFSLVCFGFCYYGIDNNIKPASCSGSGARSPRLKPFLAYLKCSIGCLIVLVYIIVVLAIYVQTKKFRFKERQQTNNNEVSFKKEIKAVKIVSAVVCTSFICSILPNIVLTVMTVQGFSTSRIGPYVTLLGLLDAAVNIALFLWRDGNIRIAFRNLFNKNNQVSVISS